MKTTRRECRFSLALLGTCVLTLKRTLTDEQLRCFRRAIEYTRADWTRARFKAFGAGKHISQKGVQGVLSKVQLS